ncbi:hypothetical protein RBB50_004883 [Rhinocladiella similis]
MADNSKASMPVPSLASTLKDSFQYGSSLRETIPESRACRTYLLGHPIAQSLAPLLHNTLFKLHGLPWTYQLLESTNQEELLSLLPQDECVGSAVTMPHKVTFTAQTHDLTSEGREIGAINTVFIRLSPAGRRRYIGTNTDCIGVREAFARHASPEQLLAAQSRPALVVGGGGACRSALYALHRFMGVGTIYMVNRFKSEVDAIVDAFSQVAGWTAKIVHVDTCEQALRLPKPYFVVGTVPDYAPATPEELLAQKISRTLLSDPSSEKGIVLEMCYFPRIQTSFYEFAEAAGWQVIPGTVAMIWQGVAQQVLWSESVMAADEEVVKQASATVLDAIERKQAHQ